MCIKPHTAIVKGTLPKVLKEEIQKTTDRQGAPPHTHPDFMCLVNKAWLLPMEETSGL